MITKWKVWDQKSHGKHLKFDQFSNEGMYFSHKWKMVPLLCILELALFFNYSNPDRHEAESYSCIGALKSQFLRL